MKKRHLFYTKIVFMLLLCFCNEMFGQSFTNVSQAAGIDFFMESEIYMGGGVAVFDHNNDGYEDLYITGGNQIDAIYENNGDFTFTKLDLAIGLEETLDNTTAGVLTADIDNDGEREIYVYTTKRADSPLLFSSPNYLFKKNDVGIYENIISQAGLLDSAMTMGASFGDYNLDGYLDLIVVDYIEEGLVGDESDPSTFYQHTCFENKFYVNNGDGTFSNRAAELELDDAGCALATSFTDLNGDHHPDIYVANDFGEWVNPNVAYLNNYPDDGFTNISQSSGLDISLYGMGIAIGDYDEDLDLDYYVTNIGRNVLLNNNGDVTFSDLTDEAGVANEFHEELYATSWGCNFADFDNDTYLDLYVSNGFIPTTSFNETQENDPCLLYHNNGDGTFSEIGQSSNLADTKIGRGSAVFDYNQDGDMDILLVNVNPNNVGSGKFRLYRNDSDSGNWIKFKLQGLKANRDGYGSKAYLYADGRAFVREIQGGSSHTSQNSSIIHFGLGEIAVVDSVKIVWPGASSQLLIGPEINNLHEVLEDTSDVVLALNDIDENRGVQIKLIPNPISINQSFYLTGLPEGVYSFELYSIEGKMIHSGTYILTNQNNFISSFTDDLLEAGSYVLKLKNPKETYSIKMLVVD